MHSALWIQVQRRYRLKSPYDFKRVRRFGKSYAHPLIVLIARHNEQERSRFAVTAGRSVGNAVHRNRAKRLLREIIRPLISEISTTWDILLIARKPLVYATYSQARQAVIQLLQRADLLVKRNEQGK